MFLTSLCNFISVVTFNVNDELHDEMSNNLFCVIISFKEMKIVYTSLMIVVWRSKICVFGKPVKSISTYFLYTPYRKNSLRRWHLLLLLLCYCLSVSRGQTTDIIRMPKWSGYVRNSQRRKDLSRTARNLC